MAIATSIKKQKNSTKSVVSLEEVAENWKRIKSRYQTAGPSPEAEPASEIASQPLGAIAQIDDLSTQQQQTPQSALESDGLYRPDTTEQTFANAIATGPESTNAPSPKKTPQSQDLQPAKLEAEQQAEQARDRAQIATLLTAKPGEEVSSENIKQAAVLMDNMYAQDFLNDRNQGLKARGTSYDEMSEKLLNKDEQHQTKSALVYMTFRGEGDKGIDLIAISPHIAEPIHAFVEVLESASPEKKSVVVKSSQELVVALVKNLTDNITDPRQRDAKAYETAAQKLYKILIAPIAAQLEEKKINQLQLVLDQQLRAIPLSALSDGSEFLLEKFALAISPSFQQTEMDSNHLKTPDVYTISENQFDDSAPLRAMAQEIQNLRSFYPDGAKAEEVFSRQKLQELVELINRETSRQQTEILHIVTHGEFINEKNGYLAAKNPQNNLTLADMEKLKLQEVELVILNACRTAEGNAKAEYGMAGKALAAGADSVMGNLWIVDDRAALALVTVLYENLSKEWGTKAQALQAAQIAMKNGLVYITRGKLFFPAAKTGSSKYV